MASTEEKIVRETSRQINDSVSPEHMEKMYHMFVEYENSLHEKNLKRIKIGILCIWIIPAIFLALMFMTGSSKIIFLVLWICSLFGIAVYLIWIEFLDYNLQEKMNEIHGTEDAKIDTLIKVPDIVNDRVMQAVERIDDSDMISLDFDEKVAVAKEALVEKKEAIAEKRSERREERAERREDLVERISERRKSKLEEGENEDEEHN